MQYTVNRGEKGKVEVKVDFPKAVFETAYGDIVATVNKETNISGFRPGNVPTNVLEDKIGVNKILNDTANFMVNKHLDEIFKKENIVPLGNPNIAIHTLAKDSPFSFTATLTSKPQVKIGDWKKLKIKKVRAREVTEKDVNESIKNIYDAWKKRKESDTGQAPSDKKEEDEQMGKAFIYDARGEKIFLKDESKGTKEPKKLEDKIDDEFAKKIGAQDLKHLQELVRKDLEKIVNGEVESKLEQEIFDEILKVGDVEVPDILIDDDLNRIIVRITQNLEQQNKKLDDYLKEQNTTLDALKAKMRPQAEKNVKITLIMDEIGKSEKIQLTKEEIENAAKGVDQSKLDEKQKSDLRNYMAVSIFQAKSLELVKKTVTA